MFSVKFTLHRSSQFSVFFSISYPFRGTAQPCGNIDQNKEPGLSQCVPIWQWQTHVWGQFPLELLFYLSTQKCFASFHFLFVNYWLKYEHLWKPQRQHNSDIISYQPTRRNERMQQIHRWFGGWRKLISRWQYRQHAFCITFLQWAHPTLFYGKIVN